MKNSSYSQILKFSFQRTKEIFLKPFSVKRWLKLLLIVLAISQLAEIGFVKDAWETFARDDSAQMENISKKDSIIKLQEFKQDVLAFWDQHQNEAIFWVLVCGAFALIILGIWLGARFIFVWLYCLFTGDIAIKEPFREYQKEGQSVFVFGLIIHFVIMTFIGLSFFYFILVALPILEIQKDMTLWQQGEVVILTSIVGLVAVLTFLAGWVFLFYINQLVIPIMAIKRVRIVEAWAEFKNLFKANKSDMLLLPLIFLGLSFLTRIGGFIVFILIGAVGLLIAALVGGALYFLFNYILSVQYVGNIILIVLGGMWLAVVIIILAMSWMPFVAFLRYFTLYFLSSLDPAYDKIRLAQPNQGEHHIQPPPSTDV